MKWIYGLIAALFGVWLIHTVSPYVAMASLGRAIQSGNRAEVARRLDLPAIRASLTHQLVNAYWDATGRRPPAGIATYAEAGAATLANPLVSDYVTEDSILSFLERGTPGSGTNGSLHGSTFARAWPLVRDAEQRGFTKVAFRLPPDAQRREQYAVVLRLKGWAWRVGGVELPATLRDQIVQRIIKDHDQTGQLEGGPRLPSLDAKPQQRTL